MFCPQDMFYWLLQLVLCLILKKIIDIVFKEILDS